MRQGHEKEERANLEMFSVDQDLERKRVELHDPDVSESDVLAKEVS